MKLYAACLIMGLLAPLAWSADQKPTREPITIIISEDDFRSSNAHPRQEVTLVPGDALVIELGSNPTTGFRWTEKPANSRPKVLKQAKHEHIQRRDKSPNGKPIVGTGGAENWIFRASKPGTATLDFSYGCPWQSGDQGIWTLKVIARISAPQR
jgi:predicted secreted protein